MVANPYKSPTVVDEPPKVHPLGFSLTELVGVVISVFLLLAIAFNWFHAIKDNGQAEMRGRQPTRRPTPMVLPVNKDARELPPANLPE